MAIRRPVRSRPIRLFLIGMFAVPLLSLVGLWAFSASLTVPGAISDHSFSVYSLTLTSPAVATLTTELPTEQQQTYLWLLSGRQASESPLIATRATISKALPGAESALQTLGSSASTATVTDLNALEAGLRRLPGIRQSVDAGTMTPAAAFQAYSDIIDTQYQTYYASTLDRGASLQAAGIGSIDAVLALELGGREVTLVDGALQVDRGQLDPGARRLFISTAANRQFLMSQALSVLPPSLRASFAAVTRSAAYRQFQALESQILAAPADQPVPVNATAWNSSSGTVFGAMLDAEIGDAAKLSAMAGGASDSLRNEAILAGGVGLLAVIVSVFLLVWFGRKVTRDLTRLDSSVLSMAQERLPRVVERLRRGDDVDVAAESPAPAGSSIGEISQIARSFGIVQEAAVRAAVEQARLRKGVNQVFLNISMRNQSLLHRQLGMLDSMERRTGDPGALADLFRLDHLTTRMRRHAEGLIILSGATPGRGWRDPVPVVDVLRAAVAEVEDYVRVDVLSESRDLIAGSAVNDVIHLVAELVENAAVFSPPNTRIEVRADRVGVGLVAEIEDRGLGLSQEELSDINRRLASPPEFDPANSDQLGLFVVSRLAARHAIKVSLRQSAFGGTTAILLLPFGVVVRAEEIEPAVGSGWPQAGRRPSARAEMPTAANGAGQAAAGPPPSFVATARRRLPSAATGRRTETVLAGQVEESRPAPSAGPPAPPAGRPPWDAEPITPWFDAFSPNPANRSPVSESPVRESPVSESPV
ncbi:MAG TPA: nitrate- and nitrite sensing domain-containing protein, partial [Trebonia sp.]|nr:nitrate- and nitrite sensing domain-containing protein [Trebonia sp.]